MAGSLFQEAVHLKELLIINLDLVQQQQELIAEKERKLHSLRQENESLKCRLERMSRRMSLCRTKQSQVQASPTPAVVGDIASNKTARRTTARDSINETVGKLDATSSTLRHVGQTRQSDESAFEHEPVRKIRIVSSGSGKTATRRTEAVVKEEQVTRTRSNSPSFKDTGSGKTRSLNAKRGKANSDILTTNKLYYVPKQCDNNVLMPDPEPSSSNNGQVMVPQWRINIVHGLYVIEGTENLNDSMYLKRHQKSENEEKRRKRWDVQRLRDLHLLQKQQRIIDNSTDSYEMSPEFISLLPDPDRVSYIAVDDCIPVSAFGQALPRLETSEFVLPWSESSIDGARTTKTKKKSR